MLRANVFFSFKNGPGYSTFSWLCTYIPHINSLSSKVWGSDTIQFELQFVRKNTIRSHRAPSSSAPPPPPITYDTIFTINRSKQACIPRTTVTSENNCKRGTISRLAGNQRGGNGAKTEMLILFIQNIVAIMSND